ncbi:MAG: VOC family protein [Trebonia sp.]
MIEPDLPLDHGDLFHLCLSVGDVEAAKARLGATRAWRWAPVEDWTLDVFLPGGGVAQMEASVTYSVNGPVHVELTRFRAGPEPAGDDLVEPHHLGYWSADVEATTESLIERGWSLEYQVGAVGGRPIAAMVRSPAGYRVELVPVTSRPRVEAWLASGRPSGSG